MISLMRVWSASLVLKASALCALLTVVKVAAPDTSRGEVAGDAAISLGGGYAPATWGGDTNGAGLLSAAFSSHTDSRWALLARAQYARYTDYPGVGRVQFIPIGLGPLYRITRGSTEPFLFAMPLGVLSKWGAGGPSHVRIGAEIGGGVDVMVRPTLGLRLSGSWLKTEDAGTIVVFDAPNIPLEALDVFVMRLEASFHWRP